MLIQSRNKTKANTKFTPKRDCKLLFEYISRLDKDFIVKNNLGDIFVKNFEQTQYCDHFVNLEQERSDVIRQINIDDKGRYSRLLRQNQEPSWKDATVATNAFVQHFSKVRLMMIDTFPWYQRLSFNVQDWYDFNLTK